MAIINGNFLFVHMTKTGGEFTRAFLILNVLWSMDIRQKHMPLGAILPCATASFSFGFVRNPFDWYVSMWSARNNTLIESELDKITFREYMNLSIAEQAPPKWGRSYIAHCVQAANVGYMTLRYWRMFFDYRYDSGRLRLDRLVNVIMKVEDGIPEGIERVFKEHIFELNAKQRDSLYAMERVNTTNHLPYREYYDDELIKLVQHKDRYILDEFGYEF